MRLRGPSILQQGQVWEERGSDAKDDEDDGGGDVIHGTLDPTENRRDGGKRNNAIESQGKRDEM